MKCLSYSEASTLSAASDHHYFRKCLDLIGTYNIPFKCPVHRKMQTSHVALERLTPHLFRERWIACWDPNAFIKRKPWLFHQNAKRPWVISLPLQTDSTFKKEACVLLFLGSAQCRFYQASAQYFCPKRCLCDLEAIHRVTLAPLMSCQLNYLLQLLFLPKRFRLR